MAADGLVTVMTAEATPPPETAALAPPADADAAMKVVVAAAFKRALAAGCTAEEAKAKARVEGKAAWLAAGGKRAQPQRPATAAPPAAPSAPDTDALSTVSQRVEVLRGKGAPLRRLVSLLSEIFEVEVAEVDFPEVETGGEEEERAEVVVEAATAEEALSALSLRDSGVGAASAAADRGGAAGARVIVFCAYKKQAREVAAALAGRGLRAVALHGDMSPAARSACDAAFRAGSATVLVATDDAARGLGAAGATHAASLSTTQLSTMHVVNFSLGASLQQCARLVCAWDMTLVRSAPP